MPVTNAKKYLSSLQDDREIYIDGERIKDVTKDYRFIGAAETMAELLQMQHDPDLSDTLTYSSPSSGDKVGMSHIQPRSMQDVKARGDAMKVWMDATCGMLGRSPDYKNVMVAAWAAAAEVFDRPSFNGSDNIQNFYEYVRENDSTMTHVLVNPQVDRSKPAHLQESDIVAQIVKETDAGIIVRGARMVATLCALANEIVVMPAAVTWHTTETHKTTDYAFGFAIPTSTPGLKFICRPPVAHFDAASPMDGPLSLRFDESDGIAVFDDVLVPWERVFLFRDKEAEAVIRGQTGAGPHALHQSVVRAASKAEFMMALALAIAQSTKIDEHNPVQVMLAETISIAEFARTCRIGAEAEAHETKFGTFSPAMRHISLWQSMFWKFYNRQCEIINTLGAGGLVGVPSFAELAGGAKKDVEKYFQSVNADSPKRIKLNRLAYDAALSSFAGRQRLYEQYYSGDPMRTQSLMFRMYPKDEHIQRVHDMLDDLEGRQNPNWPDKEGGPAFERTWD
jgi:4-hydroxyphenylacetate 3-monooxygenase